MREPVRKSNHPWLVGFCVLAIAAVYFALMAKAKYPAPGANTIYNLDAYANVDRIETRFVEKESIPLDILEPKAMAISPEGRIFVAGQNALAIYERSGSKIAEYPLNEGVSSIAFAPDGVLFVGMHDHIEMLDRRGNVTAVWATLGPKAYITSIAVDEDNLYAADAGNRTVQHYDRNGVLIGRIGDKDEDRGVPGIVVPSPYFDVAFDDEGTLWVVNPGRLGLESYQQNGDPIFSWYRPSIGSSEQATNIYKPDPLKSFSGCCNPSQIAFRSDGRLVTCDKGLVRVRVYDVTSGKFEELVIGSGTFKRAQAIRDMAIDAEDRIYLLDGHKNAIRILQQKEENNGQAG